MIRRFEFEGNIHQTLERIPVAVRRKLDRVGVKLGLDQWLALGRGERLAICHLPIEHEDECEALQQFVSEAVKRACGVEPTLIPVTERPATEAPATPPEALVERAKAEGVALDAAAWKRLDAEQRYVLFKLGAGAKPSHDFANALREFLPAVRQP